MMALGLDGVNFLACNTDAQALANCQAPKKIQLGRHITQGLGAGAKPEVGTLAAEETLNELLDELEGSNMVFLAAGMGGGTGTGACPVLARALMDQGILTVAVVTRPFAFEGRHRAKLADGGLNALEPNVDTLIVIPNQNLFAISNEETRLEDAFKMPDQVLHQGVKSITDLILRPGLINLDFADVRSVMAGMGRAMIGFGEAEGEDRARKAAEAAIRNPLLEADSLRGSRGVLINLAGGPDMGLQEAGEAVDRIHDEVDEDANIIFGAFVEDESMRGKIAVSVVATGLPAAPSKF